MREFPKNSCEAMRIVATHVCVLMFAPSFLIEIFRNSRVAHMITVCDAPVKPICAKALVLYIFSAVIIGVFDELLSSVHKSIAQKPSCKPD
jgi:hypothetical protein